MQAHQDHADPGRDRQSMAPLPEHRSQRRRGRAQADEHGREAGHEQDRGDENVAPRLRLALVGQRFDARAREIAKIGRRQRQHAGRNKREEARAERGGKGNVGHGVTDGASTTARQMGARSRPARRGLIGRSRPAAQSPYEARGFERSEIVMKIAAVHDSVARLLLDGAS